MGSPLIKISTIITTYNSQESIQRVIDSIKNQTGINEQFEIEMIIVDDCSNDETVNIIKANHLSFTSTLTNSGGPNKGRNIGLKLVTGDYICIVDHDDEWHPNKISSMLPYFDRSLIISSGFITYGPGANRKTTKINHSVDDKPYVFFEPNVTFKAILTKSITGQNRYLGSIIYSAKLKHIDFEEVYGMVDFDWALKLFHNQSSIEICASLYTRYVNHTNLSLNENYRLKDYSYSISCVAPYKKEYPKEVALSVKRTNGSLGRYYYMTDNMEKARYYLLRSELTLKTVIYYLTTFAGAKYIKRKFNVFG